MPSAIDPTFIADGSPVSKPAFRDQLLTLRAELDHGGFVVNPTTLTESTTQAALDDLYAALGGTVATIAELQALVPVPGLAIEVLGYHEPGDGGGGLFYADMSGARAEDGGTVFGYTGDLDASDTVETLAASSFLNTIGALVGADIAFGSVQLQSNEAGNPLVFDMWDLCGHSGAGGDRKILPAIDVKTGTWNGPENMQTRNYFNNRTSTSVTLTYRTYGANTRRWVRVLPGHLNVRWFGAVPGDGQDGYANRNRICWALNAAKAQGIRHVVLDGDYLCEGTVEIPDGVQLTDGSLKVPDGRAIPWLKSDYGTTHPYREKVVATGGWHQGIAPESGAMSFGLERFEYDGNFEGNLEPLQNPALYTDPLNLVGAGSDLGTMFQNTPLWGGLNSGVHGGRVIPEGQDVRLEDVHIHGTGTNTWVSNAASYVTGRNIKLGNSARNHLFYSVHGTIVGLTLYGFAWGSYGKTEGCNIFGLNVNHLVDGQAVHGFAWTNAAGIIAYEGLRYGADALTGSSEIRWGQHRGLNIVGFDIDLEGYPENEAGVLFSYAGQQLSLSNGTVLGPKTSAAPGGVVLVREGTIGPSAGNLGLYSGITVKNVRMFQRGVLLGLTSNDDLHADQSGFEDVSIEDDRGYEGATAPAVRGAAFILRADTQAKDDPKYDMAPRQMHAHRVTLKPAGQNIAFANVTHADAHQLDFHFSECVFPLTTKTLFRTENGTGTLAGMTVQDTGKIRVFMDRCRFTLDANGVWQDTELFFALTRFRGCATLDAAPLVSEAAGVASLSAVGGETSLDVATRLFWTPEVVHITPRSAAGATRFAYVEVLAKDATSAIGSVANKREPVLRLHFDQALGAGEVIALGWVAAVRPF